MLIRADLIVELNCRYKYAWTKEGTSDCTTYPSMRGAVYVTRTDIYVLVYAVQIANVEY